MRVNSFVIGTRYDTRSDHPELDLLELGSKYVFNSLPSLVIFASIVVFRQLVPEEMGSQRNRVPKAL